MALQCLLWDKEYFICCANGSCTTDIQRKHLCLTSLKLYVCVGINAVVMISSSLASWITHFKMYHLYWSPILVRFLFYLCPTYAEEVFVSTQCVWVIDSWLEDDFEKAAIGSAHFWKCGPKGVTGALPCQLALRLHFPQRWCKQVFQRVMSFGDHAVSVVWCFGTDQPRHEIQRVELQVMWCILIKEPVSVFLSTLVVFSTQYRNMSYAPLQATRLHDLQASKVCSRVAFIVARTIFCYPKWSPESTVTYTNTKWRVQIAGSFHETRLWCFISGILSVVLTFFFT